MASIDGSHDGAPTKNDRKRTKPPKAGVLALHLASRGIYVSKLCNIVGSMIESHGDRKTLNILSSYYNTIARWTYVISPQVNNVVGCTPVQQAVPVISRYSLVS